MGTASTVPEPVAEGETVADHGCCAFNTGHNDGGHTTTDSPNGAARETGNEGNEA